MLRLLTALAGLSICAYAQESSLTLYLKSKTPPAAVIASMRTETLRILAPLQMNVRWREAGAAVDEDGALVVVSFAGECSFVDYNPGRLSRSLLSRSMEERSLASTSVVDGRILPFVTLECSRLRDRLGPEIVGFGHADRDSSLGKALARVLAHEIYHVLTGQQKHADSGIASACVNIRQLLAPHFSFDNHSLALMRPPRRETFAAEDLAAEATGRD